MAGMRPTPLPPAVSGERFEFDGISCYVAGPVANTHTPLLLVHSVNAAASVAEVAPLFEHYRSSRTVFALDLPGFGFSDRSERAYAPRLMTDALHAVRAQIAKRCGPGAVDALAVSLGCEFLARAASERPGDWGRLALVSPTGFRGVQPYRDAPGSTRRMPWLQSAVSVPLWSQALFNGLTKPSVVRYFLNRTWGAKNIDEKMWDYAVKTAAQPGARHAPLQFLSGCLFSGDIFAIYESLTQPVWMSHGVRGDFTDYRAQHLLKSKPNWRITEFQTGALPYFEVPQPFIAGMDTLLAS
jgi:pimeloyl-ACP methyl ester carboxylesterase